MIETVASKLDSLGGIWIDDSLKPNQITSTKGAHMKKNKASQCGKRLLATRLTITVGLAALFLAALVWGLRETPRVHADPGTLYVDGATGQDIGTCGTSIAPCESISYTLNIRASEGDTILIAEGTYTENLTIIGITVTLRGGYTASGSQWLPDTGTTVVHGGDADRVFVIRYSNATLEDLTITGGDAPPAEAWGGGVWVSGGHVTIRSSTIVNNGDADWSMGIEVNDDYGPARLTLESSTVSYNYGGGLHLWGGTASAEVQDSTFTGNRSGDGGGVCAEGGSSVDIIDSSLSDNTATNGGAIAVEGGGTAIIEECQIMSNTASSAGGGLFASSVTVTLRYNDFISNTSQGDDGPAMWIGDSALDADSNVISYNTSNVGWVGGAVRLWQVTTTLTNNLIAQNQASGVNVTESDVGFVNNTIVSNTVEGIGVYDGSTLPLLRNNIIADNGSYGVAGDGSVTLSEYNNLWNNGSGSYEMVTVTVGSGNLAVDPLFVDAASGDYHLQPDSPCVDTGTGNGAPTTDVEGDPRPVDGDLDGTATVDMGADEFTPPSVYLPLTLRDA